ncbi:hypothetical protein [Aureimonas leprariae]|uniref:Uncharacterized protein n=1 Tax=Plantimonas leprariae TaxID=2615207 RepID=A0A7V7TY13_9HYPH|nr:hypothetical protein [Aureimonas leprariae]KAB0682695.1 hypothetical protein F6X38_00980 [Aureimonas leprariae]
MGEAKKIVTEDATAAELPERFRGDLPPDQKVVVLVLPIPDDETAKLPKYLRYWGAAAHLGTTTEEAVARVRALRDEWDDR